mmetsp:Transcript_44456/g.70673  ORF Transcript_44456/g.70673 Transcript_44456/m.70673 type:complete len:88 (-) Transcript_44456:51-314(-)
MVAMFKRLLGCLLCISPCSTTAHQHRCDDTGVLMQTTRVHSLAAPIPNRRHKRRPRRPAYRRKRERRYVQVVNSTSNVTTSLTTTVW